MNECLYSTQKPWGATRCRLGWALACSALSLFTWADGTRNPVSPFRSEPVSARGPERFPERAPEIAPELASRIHARPPIQASRQMVITAHPLASAAGLDMLRAGGSAIDAAIASQLVLAVVEPQSSGLGGGGFLLHFDGQRVQAYDGRETAPAAIDPHQFVDARGQPLPFTQAMISGQAVGVPGLLRLLERVHREHGQLPWARLFAPAIALAEQGFALGERLHTLLAADPFLARDAQARKLFYQPDGQARPRGDIIQNPDLGRVLRTVATEGATAFYEGRLARRLVAAVQADARPGHLSLADLAAYRAIERPPVCSTYRRWRLCGMPPPSSGGVTVAQILGMLAPVDMGALAPVDGKLPTAAIHYVAEAGRLAFADRQRYLADPDFVPPPGGDPSALLAPDYLQQRARLIQAHSQHTVTAGQPLGPNQRGPRPGADRSPEPASTTHLSVVDAAGRAVSLTSSIENAFGARLMVDGYLLNNQLTDFSFVAADADGPVANRIEGGKRPRSSMAPTLVFDRDTGALELVIGSPGGSAIINYVARTLVAVLDWKLPLSEAIALPHFGRRLGPTELESGRFTADEQAALRALGHRLHLAPQTSGLHGIRRLPPDPRAEGPAPVPRWEGAADPRREGLAMGD